MSDDTSTFKKAFLGHIPAESPIQSFHPAARLSAFFCLSSVPLFISIPELNALIIVAHLALLRLGMVKLKVPLTFVPLLIAMAAFMTAVAFLTAPSAGQATLPCASPLQTQLLLTLNSYVRITAMFCATLFYFSTNTERDFLSGLRSMGLPHNATYILGLSIRSAALFAEDLRSIKQAEIGRGARQRSMSLSKRITKGVMYTVPLFAIGIRRIEEISDALFCRGFAILDRSAPRMRYPGYTAASYRFERKDAVLIGALLMLLLFIGYVSFFTHSLELQASLVANGWFCHKTF